MIKQIGRKGKINIAVNKILNARNAVEGINYCQLGSILKNDKCLHTSYLQHVHRHKRGWYYAKDRTDKEVIELMSSEKETCIGCQNCHATIEPDAELTEKVFKELKGE
jgi:Na+-translocating ferredoxin:NAD+ oxidoreductase RNF subunit RnfB